MAQPFILQVCDSPERKDTVRPTLKGSCFTYVMAFFPSFLLSFLPGHSFKRIWSYSRGAVPPLSKAEGGSSVGFIHNSGGQTNWLNIISYCYLIYAQFFPQSQANPEFITISWALNKLTPSLCQDSLRAEQFAFCTSMAVSSPLQLSCWQKSNQDTKDFT